MNTLIKVSTNSIDSDAERIKELVDTIPALLKELETAMGKLASCWEGMAWETYQQAVNLYVEELTEIYTYMKKYVGSLQESSKEYGHAEQDVCSKINGVLTFF